MSPTKAAQSEAGPSSPLRHDPLIRRSKTVHHTHSRSKSHASITTPFPPLHELALPIKLNMDGPESQATSELRDPLSSPSRRGLALRAYSRQRRVFSGQDDRAPSSPDQFSRALPTQSPISPSTRRVHPSRNLGSLANPVTPGLLFSTGTDSTDGSVVLPMHSLAQADTFFGEEPTSSMSSTPSLTSPTSSLSRSTSQRSARSDRSSLMGGARYLSLNGSADLPAMIEELSPDRGASNWSRRARRWSNSMSRRMSITALNNLHSTTTPYLKAGLQELRSIFDVDTLGGAVDDQSDDDLEGATPVQRRSGNVNEQDRLALFGPGGAAAAAAASREQAVFDSPDDISPLLSRQSSSEDHLPPVQVSAKRPGISFKSQIYEAPAAHRRNHSWRKHRSLSISDLPNRETLVASVTSGKSWVQKPAANLHNIRENPARSHSVRTPLVAVGLAAMGVFIIAVCVFETSIHPDAASLPLTAFMLTQSIFAMVGLSSLALQRRWMMDLASRLIRAHVLCQALIALAAVRSLSRTAFYRHPVEAQGVNGTTAAAGIFTTPHIVAASAHADPHMSMVGSFRDQVTYLCVFIVQAALPLAFVLWAQYSIASALSRVTRHLAGSAASSRQHSISSSEGKHERRQGSLRSVEVKDSPEAPRNERMRFNSINPSISKPAATHGAAAQNSEGWLGFMITRLDAAPGTGDQPKYELDAADLTNRLNALARAEASK